MADLDIVIVSWNTRELLQDCLGGIASVSRQDGVSCAVYVVDNASTQEPLPDDVSQLGEIVLLRNARNEGFGAACNRGAFAGHSKHILFLNPDTRPLPGVFAAALQRLNDPHEPAGIVGVKMVDADGRPEISCARRPTLATFVADATGLAAIRPELGMVMHDLDYENSCFVDQVIGAFFLMRRSDFEMLGGFDDRFFVYMDEVDLAKRASDKGLRTYFLASATCYHKENGATDQVKAKRLAYSMMSRCQYALKHFSPPTAVVAIIFVAFCEPLFRCAQALLHLSFGRFSEVIQGTVRFYGWTAEKAFKGQAARRPWWA